MLKIFECDSAKSDITDLKVLGEALFAYSTKLHGIKIVDFYKCEVQKSIVDEYLNSDVTACAFSQNSDFFCFCKRSYRIYHRYPIKRDFP